MQGRRNLRGQEGTIVPPPPILAEMAAVEEKPFLSKGFDLLLAPLDPKILRPSYGPVKCIV